MAPRPTNPTQLPDLRDRLIEHWKSAAWFGASRVAHTYGPDQLMLAPSYELPPEFSDMNPDQAALTACGTEARLLREASLWWVGDEMCDLLYSTLEEIPDDVLVRHLHPPSHHGLVFFSKPWTSGIDSENPDTYITVDAFVWGKTSLHPIPHIPALANPNGVKCLSMSCYRYLDFDEPMDGHDLHLGAEWGVIEEGDEADGRTRYAARVTGPGAWVPLGRSDWPRTLQLSEPIESNEQAFVERQDRSAFEASTIQDRRMLAAFFALINSPGISHIEEQKPSRQVTRNAERHGQKPPAPVKVIYLRKPKIVRDQESEGAHHLTKRFIVRAHPWNQAYGPGFSLHRLRMRGPFVKGPDGAEFMPPREEVHVWIR